VASSTAEGYFDDGGPMSKPGNRDTAPQRPDKRGWMRWIIATVYVAAGVMHLAAPDKLLLITPSWVPLAPEVIFLTGIFEFVASAALLTRPFRFWAGVSMAAYAICVWPANFKHALYGIELPYISNSWLYHGPRLMLQPVIIWWALYSAGVIDWPFRQGSSFASDKS
jgi:uncharacterized membrane protein